MISCLYNSFSNFFTIILVFLRGIFGGFHVEIFSLIENEENTNVYLTKIKKIGVNFYILSTIGCFSFKFFFQEHLQA